MMPKTTNPPLSFVFGLSFAEQSEFFRQKLNLPTAKWDDISRSAHDRAFVVAGAAKADLLSDLHAAVQKAIDGGTTLETFRKDFREIVGKHGWHGWTGEGTKAGEAWRTRIIYETNLRTSYAAGRYAQLTDPELLSRCPYWKYIHDDGVASPRLEHVAWNGLTLRHDHPFWETHYPPNGWGCCCRVMAVPAPEEGAKTEPPEGWDAINPKTGEPQGLDKGWGYAPGKTEAENLRNIVAEKASKMPNQIAKDFLAGAEERGITPDAEKLAALRAAETEGNAKQWLVTEGKKTGKEHLAVYDAATGKEIGRYEGNYPDKIGLPLEISDLLDDRKALLVLLHNHPLSFSLSTEDLLILARPGAKKVVAYGHDKSWFAAEKGENIGIFKKVLERAKEEMNRQLVVLRQRGLNIDGLEAHLFNLALDRAGIIRYTSELDKPRKQIYTNGTKLLEAAIEAITQAVKRR